MKWSNFTLKESLVCWEVGKTSRATQGRSYMSDPPNDEGVNRLSNMSRYCASFSYIVLSCRICSTLEYAYYQPLKWKSSVYRMLISCKQLINCILVKISSDWKYTQYLKHIGKSNNMTLSNVSSNEQWCVHMCTNIFAIFWVKCNFCVIHICMVSILISTSMTWLQWWYLWQCKFAQKNALPDSGGVGRSLLTSAASENWINAWKYYKK